VHGKRTAIAEAMSGTTRQMVAQFYTFAEAYAQADDETQHEASQALIAAYPQYASLVGQVAAYTRTASKNFPGMSVVDMCLEQAVEAERAGLDLASLATAVSDYTMAVQSHPGDTMDNALMMADDRSETCSHPRSV